MAARPFQKLDGTFHKLCPPSPGEGSCEGDGVPHSMHFGEGTRDLEWGEGAKLGI